MNADLTDTITFAPADLLPAAWRQTVCLDTFAIYNPAIVRFQERLLMAYRVDSGQGAATQRRIGFCELDATLQIVPGSVRAFSDTIRGGHPRHYDPRFLVYGDRLFIHYNNNFQTRPNQLFLVELDRDTLEACTPTRPLHLTGPRQEIEKNWLFFDHDGDLFAVYQIAPHTILHVDLAGRGAIVCEPLYATAWDVTNYTNRYGPLGGGTPPVRQGDAYVGFFHSKQPLSRLHWLLRYWPMTASTRLPRYLAAIERRVRRPFEMKRYYAGAYAFSAEPPFRPRWLMPTPILRPQDEPPYQRRRRINPSADGIVYPCGAIPWGDNQWLLSYGVHDERCCLRLIALKKQNPAGWPDAILVQGEGDDETA